MKITKHEVLVLIDKGNFPNKDQILKNINDAISKVIWPINSNKFSINPVPKGNGVKPIKNACMDHLKSLGWQLEKRIQVLTDAKPGPIDAMKSIGNQSFALEWETGNISSSHRAMNKIACGMLERKLVRGILVLPSRNFYRYLTDRVGNFQELSPYFTLFKNLNLQSGYLAVIEIEYDEIDNKSPMIPKSTDGMSKYKTT